MFCGKKIITQGNQGKEEKIDFAWVIWIGMNRLGFTYRQVGQLYFGAWSDLFDVYKKQHNFVIKKGLYRIPEEDEPVSSLDIL